MEDKTSCMAITPPTDRNICTRVKLADLRDLLARTERRVSQRWQGNIPPLPEGKTKPENSSPRWGLDVSEVSNALPETGLGLASVHDVSGATHGDTAAATGYVLALLKRLADSLQSKPDKPVLWCQASPARTEFGTIHGHGLKAFGLDPGAFLFVQARHNRDVLWALEEGARTAGLLAVVGEVGTASFTESRRLTLAAAAGGTPVLLLRAHDDRMASAAETCWRVAAVPGAADPFVTNAPGNPRWRIELSRCRGGRPGAWTVEWNNETHRFHLAEKFFSRSSRMAGTPLRCTNVHAPEQLRESA